MSETSEHLHDELLITLVSLSATMVTMYCMVNKVNLNKLRPPPTECEANKLDVSFQLDLHLNKEANLAYGSAPVWTTLAREGRMTKICSSCVYSCLLIHHAYP